MKKIFFILLNICNLFALDCFAQQVDALKQPLIIAGSENEKSCCTAGSCCTGSQTPIGVMTDHVHGKGEWMLSYSYMKMNMAGNRQGTKKISNDTLFDKYYYMMAPQTMQMEMHMAMLMYGVSNRFTLMAMVGYTTNSMSMVMPGAMLMPGMKDPSASMYSTTSGINDTKIYGLYNLSTKENYRFVASLGINIPTGTIKASGNTALAVNGRQAYDMQMGTGSYSIMPDITYVRKINKFSFGVNVGEDVKLDNNNAAYKVGNVYHGTAWASYQLLSFVSGSFRIEHVISDKISGSDSLISISYPNTYVYDPTTEVKNYGGNRSCIYAGLNFYLNKPVIKNFLLQVEYGVPFAENLNGIQMSAKDNIQMGLQYKF